VTGLIAKTSCAGYECNVQDTAGHEQRSAIGSHRAAAREPQLDRTAAAGLTALQTDRKHLCSQRAKHPAICETASGFTPNL